MHHQSMFIDGCLEAVDRMVAKFMWLKPYDETVYEYILRYSCLYVRNHLHMIYSKDLSAFLSVFVFLSVCLSLYLSVCLIVCLWVSITCCSEREKLCFLKNHWLLQIALFLFLSFLVVSSWFYRVKNARYSQESRI